MAFPANNQHPNVERSSISHRLQHKMVFAWSQTVLTDLPRGDNTINLLRHVDSFGYLCKVQVFLALRLQRSSERPGVTDQLKLFCRNFSTSSTAIITRNANLPHATIKLFRTEARAMFVPYSTLWVKNERHHCTSIERGTAYQAINNNNSVRSM